MRFLEAICCILNSNAAFLAQAGYGGERGGWGGGGGGLDGLLEVLYSRLRSFTASQLFALLTALLLWRGGTPQEVEAFRAGGCVWE